MIAYLKLFRWPNLLVVALTQYLFRYGIIEPLLANQGLELSMSHVDFALLVAATLLVSAAGYAINDYFDLRTDRINKPEKIVLGRKISRRSAILYHSLFNLIAVVLGVYLALRVGHWPLLFIFLVVPTLLWMYSLRYKRRFLIGNVIVAVLSAFVVAVVWVFESHAMEVATHAELDVITHFARVYAMFAFLATLAREIIKDIEDIRGDAKTGCKTIAVVSGVGSAKRWVVIFIVALITFVAYFQLMLLNRDFDLIFTYLLLAVQFPLLILINKIITAKEKSDYRQTSRLSKLIMVAGVLSMLLFSFYLHNGYPLN